RISPIPSSSVRWRRRFTERRLSFSIKSPRWFASWVSTVWTSTWAARQKTSRRAAAARRSSAGRIWRARSFARPRPASRIGSAARARAARAAPARRAVPLWVKTRLGYDRVIVEEWLDVLLPEGLAAVSLHGRTLEQGYKGAADWQAIARAVKLARGSGVLILGNGDVKDLRDARRRIVASGVDGVLIGRAAQGAPWLFRKKDAIKAAHFDEPFFTEPAVSLEERFAIVAEHSERFEQFNGLSRFMAMRKHLTWYCRDF